MYYGDVGLLADTPFMFKAPPNTLPVSDLNLLELIAVDILLDKNILNY